MCETCGCSAEDAAETNRVPASAPNSEGSERTETSERSAKAPSRQVRVEVDLLAKNDAIARDNRAAFARQHTLAVNVMGGPGAGKTALLEATLRALPDRTRAAVIEGDQATSHDRDRIRASGCSAVQVNTGAGCHLEAEMVSRALRELGSPEGGFVFVENVGNLVCPALFDLGERARAVVMSVTEGEDKPLKYPPMFRDAEVLVVNKIDLLPYLDFDRERCLRYARQVNPTLEIFELSATRGDGMAAWKDWLCAALEAAREHGGNDGEQPRPPL